MLGFSRCHWQQIGTGGAWQLDAQEMGGGDGDIELMVMLGHHRAWREALTKREQFNLPATGAVITVADEAVLVTVEMAAVVVGDEQHGMPAIGRIILQE